MIKWIFLLPIFLILWGVTDVRSDNVFQSVLAPLILIIFTLFSVISLLYKVGLLKGQSVPGRHGGDGGGGYFGGFGSGSGGGDCGGSDGGGC